MTLRSLLLLLLPLLCCCRRQLVSTLAAASLHSYDETSWAISPAPGPQEMLWPAVGLRYTIQKTLLSLCVGVLAP
jgi:hypothetical protein